MFALIGQTSDDRDHMTPRAGQSFSDKRSFLKIGDTNPTEPAYGLQRRRMSQQSSRASRTLRGTMTDQQYGQRFRIGAEGFAMAQQAGFDQGRNAVVQTD